MGLAKRKHEELSLDVSDVLSEFAYSRHLPKAAIRAALARPDVFVPEFLRILQDSASGVPVSEEERFSVFFICHILAELRESRAFPHLIGLVRSETRVDEFDLDGIVTTNLPRILISTFNGDIDLLCETIADPEADDFVRADAFSAWVCQVLNGGLDREAAHRYLAAFSRDVEAAPGSYVWVAWTDAIADLGFEELTTHVDRAFHDGRIRKDFLYHFIDPEDFYERLNDPLKFTDREAWLRRHGYLPFDDTIGTLSQWSSPSGKVQHAQSAFQSLDIIHNPYRDVGRNDPCPCGSGRKFKKCCLH